MNKKAHKTIIANQKKLHDKMFPKQPPNEVNAAGASLRWKCVLCGKVNWRTEIKCGYCARPR